MFGFSVSKLLLLVLIILVVFFGTRMMRQLSDRAGPKGNDSKQGAADRAETDQAAAEDMTQCPHCGVYRLASARPHCPKCP